MAKQNRAVKLAAESIFNPAGELKPRGEAALVQALNKAINVQRPLAHARVRQLQAKKQPPEESLSQLNRHYLWTVSGAGGTTGAVAIKPGIGTLAALGVMAAESVTFLEATIFYMLCYTELAGVKVSDEELLSVLLESNVSQRLQGFALTALGAEAMQYRMRQAVLRFIARRGLQSGLGRVLPFGVGAAMGAVENYRAAKAVIAAMATLQDRLPALPAQGNQAALEGQAKNYRSEAAGNRHDGA